MEVKIKNNGEMLDATIEMVDGVMVVSPKEVKFEPKDGDVVASPCGREFFIFKCNQRDVHGECYCGFSFRTNTLFGAGRWHIVRLATEEEKKRFFDKLKEEGLEWKSDTKELVKLKWKPVCGYKYYKPCINKCKICPSVANWNDDYVDKCYYDKGWCFKTLEECQEFCSRLNDAINSVKP